MCLAMLSQRVTARWEALTSAEAGAGRHAFLDGLRGWGAISVMLLHYSCGPAQSWAACPAWFLPIDGNFAVRIFFSASAFSLCCIEGDARVARSVLARFPRLAVPVLFHGLVDVLVFPSSARVNAFLPLVFIAPEVSPPMEWRSTQPLRDIVSAYAEVFGRWGVPLWTMSIEMMGSLGVFLWVFIRPRVKLPVSAAVPVLLAAFARHPCYADFVLGCILHAAWPVLSAPDCSEHRRELGGALAAFVVLTLGAIPSFNSWASEAVSLIRVTTAFACVALSHHVRSALECRTSLTLGRMSFTLYISHRLVLRSAIAAVDGRARAADLNSWSAPTAAVAIPCALLWSALASGVDAWAVHASRAWASKMIEGEMPAGQKYEPVLPAAEFTDT